MSETMIERVMKAIQQLGCVDVANYKHRELIARAAIEAMREPGFAIRKITTFEFAEVKWPKLIDAALSQSPSLPTPAATPTDSANPPPVESVGPNSDEAQP